MTPDEIRAVQSWYVTAYLARLDRKRWDRDYVRECYTRIVRPRVLKDGRSQAAPRRSQATIAEEARLRADRAWARVPPHDEGQPLFDPATQRHDELYGKPARRAPVDAPRLLQDHDAPLPPRRMPESNSQRAAESSMTVEQGDNMRTVEPARVRGGQR